MRTTTVITCDLCGSTIDGEGRSIAIAIPLPKELRDAIVQDVEQAVKRSGAMFGIFPIASIVPQRWTLEACGCVLQLLPMLKDAIVQDVQRHLALKAALRAKADLPVDLEAL